MMSVAGGWFFLIACEMFVLGNRDLRLPGLGSYLQTAANEGNTRAILWGLAVMIGVIILIDQLIWRPVIAWAQKFKFEQVEAAEVGAFSGARFSEALENSAPHRRGFHHARRGSAWIYSSPGGRRSRQQDMQPRNTPQMDQPGLSLPRLLLAIAYACVRMVALVSSLNGADVRGIFAGAGATFLRVELTLALAGLWTIPVGVIIGLNPRLSSIAQPVAQIAASVPATALFPIILLMLIRVGGGLGIGSIVLLLLGTQWYILFNVIAGASAIPTDLKEVCSLYRFPALGALADPAPARNFPVSHHRVCHRVRRGLERQHRRRIFSLPGPDFFGYRTRRGDQPRNRRRQLSYAARSHHRDGQLGRHRQSLPVAPPLPPGRHAIQLRELVRPRQAAARGSFFLLEFPICAGAARRLLCGAAARKRAPLLDQQISGDDPAFIECVAELVTGRRSGRLGEVPRRTAMGGRFRPDGGQSRP